MLKVENLRKHFGGVKAVDGVSFEVRPGQCVALIGPNGAGKSSCFACLAGQYSQYDGNL
jgi:branched-chain amino acid transport system ATP-binding protein